MSTLAIGTYVIWPSRLNVIAHMQLGFVSAAYIIPLLIIGITSFYPDDIVNFYALILFFGSSMYLLGLMLGNKFPLLRLIRFKYSFQTVQDNSFNNYILKRTKYIFIFAILGLLISYVVMGFVPAFAQDPIAAKFFRGEYQAPYRRVAVLYRVSHFLIVSLIIVVLAIWYQTKQKKYLVMAMIAVFLVFISLTRQPALEGFLLFVGIVLCRKKSGVTPYVFAIVLIYFLGSSSYYIIGKIFNIPSMLSVYANNTSIWWVIASGSPDIQDQLKFLRAFLLNPQYTYGKTFIGGLVPGNFKWNPHVWSLTVLNGGSDVSNVNSGGLRLPLPIYGYTSFGWLGVFIVPFISGMILGNIVRVMQKYSNSKNVIKLSVLFLFYNVIALPLSEFYKSSMYSIPTAFICLFIIYKIFIKKSHDVRQNISYYKGLNKR